MRCVILLCLMSLPLMANSVIEPETLGRTEMAEPTPSWFIVKSFGPAYIFDGWLPSSSSRQGSCPAAFLST